MKPAPFERVSFTDTKSRCCVVSDPESHTSQVLSPSGVVLWSWSGFVGRKQLFLSPDASTLVLWGSYYFGSILQANPEAEVLEVIRSGTKAKGLDFASCLGISVEDAVSKYHPALLGGGWMPSESFLSVQAVDWEAGEIRFSFKDGTVQRTAI